MTNGEIASEAQKTLDADLAAAQGALERGDLQQALEAWADIRGRFPSEPTAYLNAALACADVGNFDKAEALLLEGRLMVETAGPPFASEFARMAARRNDGSESVRRWHAVRTAFPNHPIGWVGGVEMLRDAGQLNDAATLLTELKEYFPNEQATSILAASLADARKDWSLSADLWAQARANLPHNPVGYIRGARALIHLNRFDEADVLLANGMRQFPEKAELVAQWAELAAHRRNWPEAAERWTLMRQRYPGNPIGYVNGSGALLEIGRKREAEAVILAARERFPDQPDLHTQNPQNAGTQLSLARTLIAQDRLDEAEALLHRAIDRFPDKIEIFTEYAALASKRHDWVESLSRWRNVQKRFPQLQHLSHRAFEAELRVIETSAPSEAPLVSPQEDKARPASNVLDMRDTVTRFESLGGTLHGCEFGLFQRNCGAEPLGLLRWTEMGPGDVIAALEAEFEGVGLPENTELGVHQTPGGPEYFTKDKRFLMSMHAFIKETEIPHDKMFTQCCRRLQFLRDKIVGDLRSAQKIFVYKITWRILTPTELERMHAAIRRYGDATLLYVQREIPGKPHGTVEVTKPGLMMGYIDRFSASPNGENLGPATESWAQLCRTALAVSAGKIWPDAPATSWSSAPAAT